MPGKMSVKLSEGKIFQKKDPKSLDFEEKKKNNLSLDFWLGAYRQQGWIGKTLGELGERLLLLLKAGRIISHCPILPRVS